MIQLRTISHSGLGALIEVCTISIQSEILAERILKTLENSFPTLKIQYPFDNKQVRTLSDLEGNKHKQYVRILGGSF
ncbi:hypothetical protein J2X69_000230 [Algoriphagus sp. 4150]|nr:hypothetical protein [Algoriphagus sp. 4150]